MNRNRLAWILIGLAIATTSYAAVCCKVGERVEGDKKVCIYQCRMKQVSSTIPASQDCPATLKQ
jgi:hypothetical protein